MLAHHGLFPKTHQHEHLGLESPSLHHQEHHFEPASHAELASRHHIGAHKHATAHTLDKDQTEGRLHPKMSFKKAEPHIVGDAQHTDSEYKVSKPVHHIIPDFEEPTKGEALQ